jgi:hypothetical protein
MGHTRQPRTIDHLAGGPDKRTTDINNALYVIVEFVSRKRLATLATMPTATQLLAAIDLYISCVSAPELLARARTLRAAAETWADSNNLPASVHRAARELLSIFTPEPPGGWDDHDGYYYPDATSETGGAPCRETSEQAAQTSERTAHAAQTMMYAVNFAAVLASPRILQRAVQLPSSRHLLEHFDALVDVLSSGRLLNPSIDLPITHHAAARLRSTCATWIPGPKATADIQQAARAFLATCGVPEPPGGWDDFEGIQDE